MSVVELKRSPEPSKQRALRQSRAEPARFSRRVLEQSKDAATRCSTAAFLCISNSNLDEFFEIRVARLKEVASRLGAGRRIIAHRSAQADY